MSPTPALQAVGIDEWTWRRGYRYGTILVNLADHRVVDLMPVRSAATVAAWLAEHRTLTVVCRDRSDLYADGIHRGAPDVVPVVDRFHLVHNLRQAAEAFLGNHRPALQAATAPTAMALTRADNPIAVTSMYRGRRQSSTKGPLQAEAARQHRHAPWVAIYETLHILHAQGTPSATLARQLGIAAPRSMPTCAETRRPAPNGRSGGHRRRC
jgi:transposase